MLKIGIIGAGYWGPNLIKNFAKIDGVTVHKIVDKRIGRQNFIKAEYPNLNVSDSADELINDRETDVVVIATPVSSHYSLAKEALNANKHVFVEKPFVNSSHKAEELIDIAEKKSLKVGVGHIFTFHPSIEYVRNFISQTNGFKTNYFISNRANLRPPKTKHDVIWDLAVHDFSIINYLFGEFPVSVYTVACDCSCKGLNDMAVIVLNYTKSKKAIVHVNWHTPRKIRRFELYGNKWSIFFDDMEKQKVEIFDEGIDNRVDADDKASCKFEYKAGKVIRPTINNSEPLFKECKAFVDCVINNASYRNNGIQGLWAVKMCELAVESAHTGKEIEF